MFSALSITPFLRQALSCRRSTVLSVCQLYTVRHNSVVSPSNPLSLDDPPAASPDWNRVMTHAIKIEPPPDKSIDEIWTERSLTAKLEVTQRPPANAYSGRSVKVVGGNVADAFQRLNQILSRNKVRAQLRRAERHEKNGEKRRRLNSERWRRQFAHEVRKKVQLVNKIRSRGA